LASHFTFKSASWLASPAGALEMAAEGEADALVVPTKMPKHSHTYAWPSEAVFFRSHLFMYEDIKAMLAEDYPFMRDTILIATMKYISKKEMNAINCISSSFANTLSVWDYVNKHDDVITGAIFKAPPKVERAAESKLSKEAIQDAIRTKHNAIIPAAGRADHPGAAVPKAPQQIVCWAYGMTDGTVTGWGTDFCVLLNAMSQAGARIPILLITKGAYGRFVGESVASCWNNYSSMAMWGLIRSARQEIPNIPMLLLDFPYGTPTAQWGRTLLPSDAEQIYYHGVKFVPQIEQVPSLVRKAQEAPGGGKARTNASGSAKPMFARKMFNWGRPESKLDNVWFRQKFMAVGACWNEMPPKRTAVAA
jgi:hypothetical protein